MTGVIPVTKCSQFICEHLLPQRRTYENQRENFGTRSANVNFCYELASFIKGWEKEKQNKQKTTHALLLAGFYLTCSP